MLLGGLGFRVSRIYTSAERSETLNPKPSFVKQAVLVQTKPELGEYY